MNPQKSFFCTTRRSMDPMLRTTDLKLSIFFRRTAGRSRSRSLGCLFLMFSKNRDAVQLFVLSSFLFASPFELFDADDKTQSCPLHSVQLLQSCFVVFTPQLLHSVLPLFIIDRWFRSFGLFNYEVKYSFLPHASIGHHYSNRPLQHFRSLYRSDKEAMRR